MRANSVLRLVLLLTFGMSQSIGQFSSAQLGPEYVLKPGDTIEVTYTYTPEYNQTLSIPPDGSVGLTKVGPVTVAGLTLRSASMVIADAGIKGGLNNPEVFLTLRDYVRPQFTVLGEVNKPGKYDLHGTIRVADGLAIAGGLNKDARRRNIILVHPMSETLGRTTLINYKVLEKKHSEIMLETLADGDVLVVPTSNLSKVERVVKIANLGFYYNPAF